MNEYIKKLDEQIDYSVRKNSFSIKQDLLTDYSIYKFNNSSNEDIAVLENTIIKLFNSGFPNSIRVLCYYVVSNFNNEFNNRFFIDISSDIIKGSTNFCPTKVDLNLYSLRTFISISDTDIMESLKSFENSLKNPSFNINDIITAFYYSNFCHNLLYIYDKLESEEYIFYTTFLKKFFNEMIIIMYDTKNNSTFLSIISILSKVTWEFIAFKNLSTKEKLINSVIISLSETLIERLEELIIKINKFDFKIVLNALQLPINLYKIYIFYRDPENPNKLYENLFHRYINFLFEKIDDICDPEEFSYFLKSILDFKILDKPYNPSRYSTECFELVSKFIDLLEVLDKNSWIDINLKFISLLVDFIDYKERIDIIFTLIYESKYVSNLNDRMIILYNLFCSLIMININYSSFFNKDSLIHGLFIQNWFVILIQNSNPKKEDSRFRQDLFISLIESLFYAKKQVLNSSQLENFISIIKMGLDIIDVCMKILEWTDGGDIYKNYFLILEETCLFFDDAFFCFLYSTSKSFYTLKKQLDFTLETIGQRFLNKIWDSLAFSNENSKYLSLILLSQFLNVDNTLISSLLEVLFLRLNELPPKRSNEKYFELLLRSCLYLYLRLHKSNRESIIIKLRNFMDSIKQLDVVTENILSFGESISNYMLENIDKPQIILNTKLIDELNNEFSMFIPLEISDNKINSLSAYNNILLLNIVHNSNSVINFENLIKCTTIEEGFNPSTCLEYIKNAYYYSLVEFNNEYCHFLIDNRKKYIFTDFKCVSGFCDVIHIFYKYKMNIENKTVELFVKSFNRTSVAVRNLTINVGLNKNLLPNNTKSLNQYTNIYLNNQEFTVELLSPHSSFDFTITFLVKNFDKNNISLESSFEVITEYNNICNLKSETFHVKMIDFFIPDDFSLYDAKKFEVFSNALDYCFTIKCYVNLSPEVIIKDISKNFSVVEYKYKDTTLDMSKQIINYLKSSYYKDFAVSKEDKNICFNDYEENTKKNFKLKLSAFCVFNFWLYIQIHGDYNFSSNKSILNIEFKSNDLGALKTINNEKVVFLSELFNNEIKFY